MCTLARRKACRRDERKRQRSCFRLVANTHLIFDFDASVVVQFNLAAPWNWVSLCSAKLSV